MFEPENLPPPDEHGLFVHPDVPDIPDEEGPGLKLLLAQLGYESRFLLMTADAPEELVDAYFEGEDLTIPARWTPSVPAGEGWRLAAKFDTEDGPCVLYVRRSLQ